MRLGITVAGLEVEAYLRAYSPRSMKREFLNDAEEFLHLYSAAEDADVHHAFVHFDTDYGFGFPVHGFA